LDTGTPITFFIKYIRVFHPAGDCDAVQVGFCPTCASPLESHENSRAALPGRTAINLTDEINKVTKQSFHGLVADI